MKVFRAADAGDTECARKAVSMIVGRDTSKLDLDGIVRAAVETVAENTSDGVTAPMFWIAIGGAVGGFVYKAVNTMDSMIGYKNEKYKDLGRTAAKLDDVLNYIPSRFTALLMVFSCPFMEKMHTASGNVTKESMQVRIQPRQNQRVPVHFIFV